MNNQELIVHVDALACEITELSSVVDRLKKRVADLSFALKPQSTKSPKEPEILDIFKTSWQSKQNPQSQREHFTFEEAGNRLGIKGGTVRKWAAQGKVKTFRLGPGRTYIHISEIERLLAERQVTPLPTQDEQNT